ncbi:MAG: hypothetical protein ACRD99_05940 [Nitrososphaera sp.]
MSLVSELVITCISDDQGFAAEVYNYLYTMLQKQRDFDQGENMHVDRQLVALLENEILVSDDTKVPRKIVKWALESFLKQSREKYKDYDVIEFGDSLTIGKVLHPSKMDMLTCEICGYFTPHEGEVETHRMTHFGI